MRQPSPASGSRGRAPSGASRKRCRRRARQRVVRARTAWPSSSLRGLGLGLLALAVLILFTKPLKRRRREVWSHERRIAHRYDCVVVDVVSIAEGAVATAPPTQIPDFESLATLARYCERPILRETRDGVQSYAVEDGGRLYVYRVSPQRPSEPVVAEHVAPAPRPPRRRRSATAAPASRPWFGSACPCCSSSPCSPRPSRSRAPTPSRPATPAWRRNRSRWARSPRASAPA